MLTKLHNLVIFLLAEYKRVYENYNLPPRDIYAECSDGLWVRRAWTTPGRFGWGRWEKVS